MTASNSDAECLLKLDKLDRERQALEKSLQSAKDSHQRAKRDLETAKGELSVAEDEVRKFSVKSKSIDADLKSLDEECERLVRTRDAASSTAAMDAASKELDKRRAEKDELESAGLECLESIEKFQALVEKKSNAIEGLESTVAKEEVKSREMEENSVSECSENDDQRESIVQNLESDLRSKYQSLVGKYGYNAICWSDGEVCLGCDVQLTVGALKAAASETVVVRCTSCDRILVGVR